MSDLTEAEFGEQVIEFLIDEFGEEAVDTEVHIDTLDTDRYLDILVDIDPARLCIELKTDSTAAIEGVGQAALYAAHIDNGRPVVLVPESGLNRMERLLLATDVPIYTLREIGGEAK